MEELNPVRRLHDILKDAVENGENEFSTGDVLQKYIKANNLSSRSQLLIEFMVILREAEQVVENLKTGKNIHSYLKPIQSLQNIFFDLGFNLTWPQVRERIVTQNLVYLLDICADSITIEANKSYISESELQEFLEKFQSLLQEVDASDLEDNTKIFLKLRLEELCEAIRQLSFEDPEALRETVNATVGKIVIGSIQITQEDREKSTFKDVVEWVGKFGAIVTLSRTTQEWLVPQLINQVHNIQKLLSSGG
ncbi:hypothetical protein ACSQ6I_02250 [Anabaena sp. WFMT]|uniref:hypothetical protein n=1 Tax=Anabaena sp. WFMT TaxID=3449730 RepID=UPI003F2904DC